jgi:hypothetical protein
MGRRNIVQMNMEIRPVIPFTRIIFILAALLAAIAGIQLYILTDYTDHFFAWTIKQPLSATFLGAGYWTGVALLLFSTFERAWANIRVAIAAVSVFVPLILITTLLHLDRFHFGVTDANALVAAWAWMIVYVIVPFLLIAILFFQLRTPGGDPPREASLPLWLRLLLGVNAIIALPLGLLLLLAPPVLFPFWPWELTPLTARAIGVGFLSLCVASIQFIRENAWSRGRVGTTSYLLIGLLQLIAIARYSDTFFWTRPGAWLYLLYMLAIFGGGIYSTIAAWRPRATIFGSTHS